MNPDDPRHGTTAGQLAHVKEGEKPCEPCREARRAYQRKREKEYHLTGRRRVMPPDLLVRHLRRLLASGMTQADIARAAGIGHSTVQRIIEQRKPVLVSTATKLAAVQPRESDTYRPAVGYRRMLQALVALGHPFQDLAARCNMKPPRFTMFVYGQTGENKVRKSTAEVIERVYSELSMTPGHSVFSRNRAEKNGWVLPLAWNDIHDPDEEPTGWQYQPADRADLLADLDEHMAGITEVCNHLGITRHALEKWCERHGHMDTYSRMVRREFNEFQRDAS